MSRKKRAQHENHERWLVSYADFITLLFAFFVVMFASSQADKGKAKQVSDSVREALENGRMSSVLASILGGTVDDTGKGSAQMKGPGGAHQAREVPAPEKPSDLAEPEQHLGSDLKAEIDAGELRITMEPRGLVISLREAAFFSPGDDVVNPRTYEVIGKIASALQKINNSVRLEGHTDSQPIHNSRFRSNWELSAARAIAMLALFSERYGISRERLAVVGYAETVPLESNDSSEGRARNRRVDIVILNEMGMRPEARPQVAQKGLEKRS